MTDFSLAGPNRRGVRELFTLEPTGLAVAWLAYDLHFRNHTDAALLHPFFRVRTIESLVHDRVACPTVLFYPGTRVGQLGLRFLGFYSEDANYRSSIVGGAV